MSKLNDSGERVSITLSGAVLTLEQIAPSLGRRLNVTLGPVAMDRLRASRAMLERMAAGAAAVYGVNTGVGMLCRQRIPVDQLAKLQENLIISHAVGVGPLMPAELVRWMMLLKIQALAVGHSGVSPAAVELLAAMLNADLLPAIPTRGSLGASGDLAPLSHLVMPMIGRGEVLRADGGVEPAGEALGRAGLRPVVLGAKDGLGLINGTQFMLSYAAAIAVRARRLAKVADIVATMSLEACRGSLRPFDERLLALRAHRGAVETGVNVNQLMAGSEILPSHADCGKVQDPYSLRCVPQVHGACRDALRHFAEVVETELNAVTDNPILIDGESISGGNFHGEPLALATDYVTMALTEWASISERRTYLLLSGPDGLPPLLLSDTGINSGYMIPQYTAAALVSECKVLSHPASVDSIPSSLGQEDHVSMGATSVVKAWQVIEHAEMVIAIELLSAAQGLDFRQPLKAGRGPAAAHAAMRRVVPNATADRELGRDIAAAAELVRNGALLTEVERAVGRLI